MRLLTFGFILIGYVAKAQSVPADTILELVEQAPSVQRKIEILNEAAIRLNNSDLKVSYKYASEAYKLARETGDERGVIQALLTRGRYYTRVGRHDVAMEDYWDALKRSEALGDSLLIVQSYKIIGNGYYFRDDVVSASQFYKKALKAKGELNDVETADLKHNIALVLTHRHAFDSAELFFSEAIALYEQNEQPRKLANAWTNLGDVKLAQLQYKEALTDFKKGLSINRTNGFTLQEGHALSRICEILIDINELDEANTYGEQALAIALGQGFQPLLSNTYNSLYKLNKKKGNVRQALAYHEKLLSVKDSAFSEEKNRQIEELRTKYESEEKDLRNQQLEVEAELKEKQLTSIRLLLALSLIFTAIVCALAVIYYRALRQNKEARHRLQMLHGELQEKNEEIVAQTEELQEANVQIAAMNENLELLVKEKTTQILQQHAILNQYAFQNAHKVRGPLARILGLVALMKLNENSREDLIDLLTKIEGASVELDRVVKEINDRLQGSEAETH